MKITNNTASLPSLIRRLWSHITQHRKHQFALLSGLMFVSAFTEVISLGAILPFIGVLIAPESVFEYPIVQNVAYFFGINSPEQLILPLTITFAVAALVAGIMRIILLWAST
jgi:ATP-binding cassette, subfamily B, bacterial PglK